MSRQHTALRWKKIARRKHPRARTSGFTLIEAIATITIVATIAIVASRTIFSAIDSYAAAATRAELHASLTTALDRISSELSNIPLKASASPAVADISSVTGSSITWSSNSSLALSGTDLAYTDAGATAVRLLNNVSAFSVACSDESNAALPASLSGGTCDPIRRISITLSTERGGITETLRARFFLRALVAGGAN